MSLFQDKNRSRYLALFLNNRFNVHFYLWPEACRYLTESGKLLNPSFIGDIIVSLDLADYFKNYY